MIGIGIDSDVTRAAIKAIRDVMDRNACLDDYDKLIHSSQQRKLFMQLGVPIPSTQGPYTNTVNCANNPAIDESLLLQQLFPNSCRQQLPPCIRVQAGGLSVQALSSSFAVERKVVVVHLSFVNDEQLCTPSDQQAQHPLQIQHDNAEGSSKCVTVENNKIVLDIESNRSTGVKPIGGLIKHGFQISNEPILEAKTPEHITHRLIC
jgi:hypothetical protein